MNYNENTNKINQIMTIKNLPSLDESVEAALNLFIKEKPYFLGASSFKFPLVVGSGNAINAGRVIFGDQAALFATESNFKEIIRDYRELFNKKIVKEVVIISASGEKDSVWETALAKKNHLKTILFTCSANSSAAKLADQVFLFKKLPEPYTYNVSTYLGMIMAAKKEDAKKIKNFIAQLRLPKNFSHYSAYTFVLPDEFAAIAPMLEIKRHELFGPRLSLRAFSYGEARHAKFVNPWDKELVISFGKNKYFGLARQRWEIKLPKGAGAGLVMASAYSLIGQIQKTKPAFYKKNIANYCQDGPKAYGHGGKFSVIVE